MGLASQPVWDVMLQTHIVFVMITKCCRHVTYNCDCPEEGLELEDHHVFLSSSDFADLANGASALIVLVDEESLLPVCNNSMHGRSVFYVTIQCSHHLASKNSCQATFEQWLH